MGAGCWRTSCTSSWERSWRFGLSCVISSCSDVETASIRVYKEPEAANLTSSGSIALKLKTKPVRGGVYCIWSNNAPGRWTNPSCFGTSWNRRVWTVCWWLLDLCHRGPRRMAVCLGGVGGWGVRAGSRGVGDPRSLWEEAILGNSRAGIMNSIKRQAASKATQKKLQQGDSTSSLSTHEKLSCDFHVRVIIAKVHSAYLLNLMHMSGLQA